MLVIKKLCYYKKKKIQDIYFTFIHPKNPVKTCITVCTKILSSTIVFNSDNIKKYFLSSKSAQ